MNTNPHKTDADTEPARNSGERGFTRTDLTVLIAVIGLLVVVMLPALAGDRAVSETYRCLNNLRQLTTAWMMYSGDNSDTICRTGGTFSGVADPYSPSAQPGELLANWVLGIDAYSPNPDFIRNGLLYAYVRDLSIYKCPADLKTVNGAPTLRSVSMNAWMNPINTEGQLDPDYVIFRVQPDIRNPAATWLLIDENPNSINDGWFLARPNTFTMWRDIPAAYHRGGAGISFADTHVEIKRWTDRIVVSQGPPLSRADPNSGDLVWLLERTTYER